MFYHLVLHLMILCNTRRVNIGAAIQNLPDTDKLSIIQDAAYQLSIDDKAKLVKYLLGDGEFKIVVEPINAKHQVSTMDKVEMGVLLGAIADKLKTSS